MMFPKSFLSRSSSLFPLVLILAASQAVLAQDPLPIDNLSDRTTYDNRVWFRVRPTEGYIYQVLLNGRPVPTDLTNWVETADYHELRVSRTNTASGAVSNRLVRFVVRNTARGTTEDALITWTPYPNIPATAAELADAHLDLIMPQNYPTGLEIPVVAWIRNSADQAVRANGLLTAPGHPSIPLRRGVGSGFLAATNPAGEVTYAAQLPGLSANRVVELDTSTTWTTAPTTISSDTIWGADSRIAVTADLTINAGVTLTIQSGTVVRLNGGVNVTNNGRMLLQGMASRPVVFTPVSRAQPWGGFFLLRNTSQMDANNTIFIASGSRQSGFCGHRCEQPLFFMDNQARAGLTNCAAMYLAGQFFHSNNRDTSLLSFTWARSLVQRCTTGGEFWSVSFKFLESAFIEVPFDDGEYGTVIDSDYDGMYLDIGNYEFRDSLIGWVKDDGLDSGSGGGPVNILMTNCWVEAVYHEGCAWSNTGREITNAHMVVINCGQGIENGWSGGCTVNSPNVRVVDSLSLANGVGVRHGDNYGWEYDGFLWLTNSLVLHNYRDVWGQNTDVNCAAQASDWAYRADLMDVRSNFLSQPNTFHPSNALWNPTTDAWRLARFMTTPPDAPVGIGLAVWTNQFPMTNLFRGVPVRLSCFTTNPVGVGYRFEDAAQQALATGTLTFAPGETVKRIYPAGFDVRDHALVRVVLTAPQSGELTGETTAVFQGSAPAVQLSLALLTNFFQGYRLLEGTFVALNSPATEPVSVDYTFEAAGQTLQAGTLVFNPLETLQQVFLTSVVPSAYPLIRLSVSNPANAALVGLTSVSFTNAPLTMYLATGTGPLPLDQITNGIPVGLTGPAPAGTTVDFEVEGNHGGATNGTLVFAPGDTLRRILVPTINRAAQDFVCVSLRDAVVVSLGSPTSACYVRTLPTPPPVGLVTNNSSWRYLDTGGDPGTAWRQLAYNDNTWSNGVAQLGFADGDERTPIRRVGTNGQPTISFYFRQKFVLADPGQFADLSLWLLRDDGGVVYLNGTELYRSPSMPQAPAVITYQTLANNLGSSAPPDNTVDTNTVSATPLTSGTNLVAVEIHQHRSDSSDVSFDFALTGQPLAEQPLFWGRLSGQDVLAWSNPAFDLQLSDRVTGPWTNVVGAVSPFVVTPGPGNAFYRLRK